VRAVICGAPAYFERHGVPQTPADLAHHRLIDRVGMFGSGEWRFGDEEASVSVDSRLQCNTNDAAIEAVAAGWGVSRFLSYQVGPDLASGRLQAALVEDEPPPVPIHIVHAEGAAVSAKVRAFVDFAAGRLRAERVLNP
jgi:DNA-binding transcriptional LysR family regulator